MMDKCNNRARLHKSVVCFALMLGGLAAAHAAQSSLSTPVVGHMPIASAVTLTPAAPKVGETVSVSWAYDDADGDVQSASTVQWLLNGVVVAGQVGTSYTLPSDAGNKTLQARVTPVSAAPASPAVGVAASSATVTIADLMARFTRPGTFLSWNNADAYCRQLTPAARLPTRAELQELFIDATSATAIGQINTDMCDVYGWPLPDSCGGNGNHYWTSESDSRVGYHHIVDMRDGTSNQTGSDVSKRPFTCIR